MELEDRLDFLEAAYRSLHAEHIALAEVCMSMLPLISLSTADIQRTLLQAYDGMNKYMDNRGLDEEMQQAARARIDAFSAAILAAVHIRHQVQKND